jgi:gas vesicle protein
MISFLAGALCGVLVGGVTGLLLAPYAGSELRKNLQSRVDSLVVKGQQAAALKRAELEAQFEAFKQGQPVVLEEPPEPSAG